MWKVTFILLLWFQPEMGSAQFGNMMEQGLNDMFKSLDFGFQNLGAAISNRIQAQLAPLQNLGNEIFTNVQRNLMPVYALNIKKNMEEGVGGTTVITYPGYQPRSFIARYGQRYSCSGRIQGARCLGEEIPFGIRTRQDYCYTKSYAVVNNRICLASNNINVNVFNDNVECQSSDNTPVIMLNRNEYYQMCGHRMPWQATYTYYADYNDPRAIPIPNSNPYVKCLNNVPGVCVFEGTEGSGNGQSFYSNNFVSYNSF